ncbi:purC [Symbiodinium natans]|uniref:phosphoribosylaminoimidazolesuccinocarboxamide synthase n=1 Tax=Symbiodinium natans TaxID=878477 RepID=A0A812IAF6_9DINO|nr:purC [Symbiodinium natans]
MSYISEQTGAGIARIAESHAALGRLPAPQLPEPDSTTSRTAVFDRVASSYDRASKDCEELVNALPRGVLGSIIKAQATFRGYVFRARYFAKARAVAAYCKAVAWPELHPQLEGETVELASDKDKKKKKSKMDKTGMASNKADASNLNQTISDFQPTVSKYLGGEGNAAAKQSASPTASPMRNTMNSTMGSTKGSMMATQEVRNRAWPLPTADHRACADLFALYMYNLYRRKELTNMWSTLCKAYERGMDSYAELLHRNPALKPMLESIAAQLKRGSVVGYDKAFIAKNKKEPTGEQATGGRVKPVDADIFKSKAGSTRQGMGQTAQSAAAGEEAATGKPAPTASPGATATMAMSMKSMNLTVGEKTEESDVQVTGEYLTNYLKEMDGDDSQFKDINPAVVPLSTGTSPPRLQPAESILKAEDLSSTNEGVGTATNGSAEASFKAKIREYLDLTLPECFIPELGEQKQGKVRSIYFSGKNVVMVTNDRVSAFDYILPNLIPFKGQVLNMISEWAFSQTKDIIPNALIENVDASVVVQKKMKNLNVELIVRGYLWGSMAAAYEKGDRSFCGLKLPDGLIRFQKLEKPIFTPTTKAEVGHDENMTMEDMEKLLGKELAQKAMEAAMKLFQRGSELMRKRGLLLLDTKYEFGLDDKGVIHVIDEVNTPDSSRMCTIEEYEAKYPKIAEEMKTGKYPNVTELMKAKPDLKMKEFSKQYVRDALLDLGFDPTKDKSAPKLSDDQVVECAYRYIKIYETVTGNSFQFPPKMAPEKRIISNLSRAGMIRGCLALLAVETDADKRQAETIKTDLDSFKIPSQVVVLPKDAALEQLVADYNKATEPMVMLLCGSTASAASSPGPLQSTVFPVIACPADGAATPAAGLALPASTGRGRQVAQILAHGAKEVRACLEAKIQDEEQLRKKARTG